MRLPILLSLSLLAAAAWSEPRHFVFIGDVDTVDLTLDFKAAGRFPDRTELSGDYMEKQGDFRIFAEDYYAAKAVSRHATYGGTYEGYAFDHFLDVHTAGDPPGYDTFEADWNAHMVDGKGDTLELQGSITPQWNDSLQETRSFFWDIRHPGGNVQCPCFRLAASDSVRLDFPVPDENKPVPILARGFLRAQGRRILLISPLQTLTLSPPEWASSLAVFTASGRRVFATRLAASEPVRMPPGLALGRVYVSYYRD